MLVSPRPKLSVAIAVNVFVPSESEILDAVSANTAARTRLDRSNPNIALNQLGYITGGVLSTGAPLDLDPTGPMAAIPGIIVRVSLDVGCVTVNGDYRLTGVSVKINREEGERVSVALQPVGTLTP